MAFASEPLSMSGMSSNEVVTKPSSAKCLIKMDRNLSFSSLLPSVAIPNHLFKLGSFKGAFNLPTDSFATAPLKIWVVLVLPHAYFWAIFESGNIRLNSLPE